MSAQIELFCPSRGRPQAARELVATFEATARAGVAELVFLVDRDDDQRHAYTHPRTEYGKPTGDPTGPLNRAALASTAPIVGFIGDDSRFETPGWDGRVLDALRTPGFAWADDGHNSPWPSTVFVSRELVQKLGWLALPTLHRGFFDRVWVDLAHATQTVHVLPGVMIRHKNLPAGHRDGPSRETIAADERAYEAWHRDGFARDVRAVQSVVDLAHFFPASA